MHLRVMHAMVLHGADQVCCSIEARREIMRIEMLTSWRLAHLTLPPVVIANSSTNLAGHMSAAAVLLRNDWPHAQACLQKSCARVGEAETAQQVVWQQNQYRALTLDTRHDLRHSHRWLLSLTSHRQL